MNVLQQLPLHRLAYVHMGGGHEQDGVYHDTHAGAVPDGAFTLLGELCGRVDPPGVMLERDDNFPSVEELCRELDAIHEVIRNARMKKAEV